MALDDRAPLFVISVAAELSGMHPQTLRTYDRLGLVVPSRTAGRGRRYSARDIRRLRKVQELSQDEGVNLAGIKQIMELELEVAELRDRLASAEERIASYEAMLGRSRRVFHTTAEGEAVPLRRGERPRRPGPESSALVVWRPVSRR
jgi:MerR family transcriptional regulator, heat shock protein HspR